MGPSMDGLIEAPWRQFRLLLEFELGLSLRSLVVNQCVWVSQQSATKRVKEQADMVSPSMLHVTV